jgi:hypothetical protein
MWAVGTGNPNVRPQTTEVDMNLHVSLVKTKKTIKKITVLPHPLKTKVKAKPTSKTPARLAARPAIGQSPTSSSNFFPS